MQRAHQLAFRREWDFPDAGEPLVEGIGAQAALSRRHQQRAFCGIALHGPSAGRLLNRGVVRAVGRRKRAFQFDAQRPFDGPPSVSLNGAVGGIPGALECDAPARGDDHAHRHLVLRERARFIRGDHRGGAERLHCGQVPDDGVPPRHTLHADREHGCHNGGKTFGNRRDG